MPSSVRDERTEVERAGRRAALWRNLTAVLVLATLQQPMLAALRRDVAGESFVDACTVPARLALVLDVALVVAVAMVALRGHQLARANAGGERTAAVRLTGRLQWLVYSACAANLGENALLWLSSADAASRTATCPPLSVDVPGLPVSLTAAVTGLSAAGVLAVLAVVATQGVRRGRGAAAIDQDASQPAPRWQVRGPRPDTVICCSGGGIRSAAFSLGGLQELTDRGVYDRADTVYGVSGGGYIAAAWHCLRVPHAVSGSPPASPPPGAPFSPTSPELAHLRRSSRYLASGVPVVTFAVLSLLFGLAVNLVLLAVLLRLLTWLLGWGLADAAALQGLQGRDASVVFAGEWAWVEWVWLVAVAGAALFVVEKVVFERWRPPGHRVVRATRALGVTLIWVGALACGLLLGVPHAIAGMHDLATTNQPTPQLAGALHAVGFASDETCERVFAAELVTARELGGVRRYGACGEVASTAGPAGLEGRFARGEASGATGLLAVLTSLLAVAPAARARRVDPVSSVARVPALLVRLWRPARDVLLPWAATAVLATTVLLVGLRWTHDLATTPQLRSQWTVLYAGMAAFVLLRLLTDANSTSLHHFYRERLASTFLLRRTGDGQVESFPYREPLRFSRAAPSDGPALVLCGAANVSDAAWIPSERHCTPFTFSHQRIGFSDASLPGGGAAPPAGIYERVADARYRDATIPAAMAISGAAVAPMAGRRSASIRPYRLVLALANARLGVWLPNPNWVDEVAVVRRLVRQGSPEAVPAAAALPAGSRSALTARLTPREQAWLASGGRGAPVAPAWLRRSRRAREALWSYLGKPGPFRVLREAVGRSSVLDRSVYVTDGGHYDNLGLVEALRARPRHVYLLDASADDEDAFTALGEAVATARTDLGVDVRVDPTGMRRRPGGRARAAWVHGTAVHPDGSRTTVHLVKALLVDDLPWDVESYAARHPSFPRTSTRDQLYGEWDLEAYRELGRRLVRRMLDAVPTPPDAPRAASGAATDATPGAPPTGAGRPPAPRASASAGVRRG